MLLFLSLDKPWTLKFKADDLPPLAKVSFFELQGY